MGEAPCSYSSAGQLYGTIARAQITIAYTYSPCTYIILARACYISTPQLTLIYLPKNLQDSPESPAKRWGWGYAHSLNLGLWMKLRLILSTQLLF